MGAAGRKAPAGSLETTRAANSRDHRFAPGPRPPAQRAAVEAGSTTLADINRLPGLTRRRSNAALTPKGGLATTRNDDLGNRRSEASAWTTMIEAPKRSRRSCRE